MPLADSGAPGNPGSVPEDLAGLNLIELLELLEPVPAPEPVSLWPQTPLWTWLGVIILMLLIRLAYRRWRRWQGNAYRRAALAEITQAGGDPAQLSAVLRRTALCAFPRRDVASLYGKDWLQFLEAACPGAGFDSEAALTLAAAPYNPAAAEPAAEQLAELASFWIRHHRVPVDQS